MTPLQDVYDAFLAKMTDEEFVELGEEYMKAECRKLLDTAIARFKFPRNSLDIQGESFTSDLNNQEIQILSQYMKCEWLNRSILSWENVKPLYEERDFSPANLLDKLKQLLEVEKKDALELERIYYRSIKTKPWDYSKLAGK